MSSASRTPSSKSHPLPAAASRKKTASATASKKKPSTNKKKKKLATKANNVAEQGSATKFTPDQWMDILHLDKEPVSKDGWRSRKISYDEPVTLAMYLDLVLGSTIMFFGGADKVKLTSSKNGYVLTIPRVAQ